MWVFEHFWYFAIIGLAVIATLGIRWLLSGESSGRVFWAASLVTGVLLALNGAIDTPQERIIGLCRKLAEAVDRGEVTAIGERLAPSFSTDGLDRDSFLEFLTVALSRARIDRARLSNFSITLKSEDRATATFHAKCNIKSAEGFFGALPSRWRLQLINTQQDWRVECIESVPVPPLNLTNRRLISGYGNGS